MDSPLGKEATTEVLRSVTADLLQNGTDSEFDELVTLATVLCGKPMGAVTLIDHETLHLKARVGMCGGTVVPVRESVCQYTARSAEVLVIEDLDVDARFAGLDMGGVRFYAGAPLMSSTGIAVGALCVMDSEPASLTAEQKRMLAVLGRQLSNHLQLRERALELSRIHEQGQRAKELFRTVLDNVPAEIYMKDAQGRFVFYNDHLCTRFNISRTAWLGKTAYDVFPHAFAAATECEEQHVLRTGAATSRIEAMQEGDTTTYWKLVLAACKSEAGEPMLSGVAMDMTEDLRREVDLQRMQDELEEANRKLNSLALTDALTGLWNRRAFDARLETGMVGARRRSESMTLMLMDVDNFKAINDTHGHAYGDTVLRTLAAIITKTKRAEDDACRFGGEEFALLSPASDVRGAEVLAERLLAAVRQYPWEKGTVTISIGLTNCAHMLNSDQAVDAADMALYQAKRTGKNRLVCCEGPVSTKPALVPAA